MSVFPLNIGNKEDHIDKIAKLAGVDPKYFETAEEINKKRQALEELKNLIDAYDAGEGKTYTTIASAMAVVPLPVNNVPFRVENLIPTVDDGKYIYLSTETNGYKKVGEILKKASLIADGNLDVATSDKVFDYVALETTARSNADDYLQAQINDRAFKSYVDDIDAFLQGQINTKAPINNPTFTGTVGGITKNMIGLSNVDDTSDLNKPISTATQNALNTKQDIITTSPIVTGNTGLAVSGEVADAITVETNARVLADTALQENLETTFKNEILEESEKTEIFAGSYGNRAFSSAGLYLGSETTYKSSGGILPNSFAVNETKNYYYTGEIQANSSSIAGVVYLGVSNNFLGSQITDVGIYVDEPLTLPVGTNQIVASSYLVNPKIKESVFVGIPKNNREQIAFINTSLQGEGVISLVTGATFVNNRAYNSSGTNVADGTGYKGTGGGLPNSFAVDDEKNYYFTGEIQDNNQSIAGILYKNDIGNILGFECTAIQVYTDFKLTIPTGTTNIVASSFGVNPVLKESVNDFKFNLPFNFYVDASVASTGTGTAISPFKTINEAITAMANLPIAECFIKTGTYRETLDFKKLGSGTYKFTKLQGDTVDILGSNKIEGFTLTSGQTNTYQATFTGTIISQTRLGKLIYEDGRNSFPIDEATEQHALQKGLTYRLPFSVLTPQTSIATVEANAGTFWHDVASNLIYIHTTDSNNPSTNGYSYENIVRDGNTVKDSKTTIAKGSLDLFELNFKFLNNGLNFRGFKNVKRYYCSILASSGNGFGDDTAYVFSYQDEVGYVSGDGINGHFNQLTGFATLPVRQSDGHAIYIDLWAHDNADDGASHHERHEVTIQGGLFEYNGDAGYVGSNDANIRIYDAFARKNGQRKNIIPNEFVGGEGFGHRSNSGNNRRAGTMICYNCVAIENYTGFNGFMTVVNCFSKNSVNYEYGVLKSINSKVFRTDANTSKYKAGIPIIENGIELV